MSSKRKIAAIGLVAALLASPALAQTVAGIQWTANQCGPYPLGSARCEVLKLVKSRYFRSMETNSIGKITCATMRTARTSTT
jgi:hypothetical protein